MRNLAIVLLLVLGVETACAAVSKGLSQRVFVGSEVEDATSIFHTIYFSGSKGKIRRIVVIWNGGCCKKPEIEEYRLKGTRYRHFKSYGLSGKRRNLVQAYLCAGGAPPVPLAKRKSAPARLLDSDVKSGLDDAPAFKGCKPQ